MYYLSPYYLITLFILVFFPMFSCAEETHDKKITTEIELDPYYTSIGLYASLTGKPIPHLGEKSEIEIYKELIKKFHKPRTLVLEASINPLPYLGTVIKRNYPDFYDDMQINSNLNLVKAITVGFEEPWALSMFFGNVVKFDSVKKEIYGKRMGYSGFLIDIGDYHIKDNELILDKWIQTELKLKGEQFLEDRTLKWSFRIGAKFHSNENIQDAFFVGIRRSRADFSRRFASDQNTLTNEGSQKLPTDLILKNSGIEYISDFSQKDLTPIRHYLVVDKKFQLSKRVMFSLGFGFVWTGGKKYSGSLKSYVNDSTRFQIVIRPKLEF